MPKEYRVTWEIDVIADSPKEAAEKARQMQQWPREGYWCGVFETWDEDGRGVRVDLDDGTEESLTEDSTHGA